MKVYFLLLPLFILSCSKNAENGEKPKQTTEEQCFILNEGINYEDVKKPTAPLTHEEILKDLPAHIQMKNLTNFQKFNYDLKTTEKLQAKEKKYFESPEYQKKFAEWITALPEFNYVSIQDHYALAKNKYGLWIIEKSNNDFKPYFLGLTQNVYLPDFYGKDQKFLQNNAFVMNGTLVNIQRLSRVPMLPKYEVIKDGVQFVINLDDIKKDSDKDGFNDLFENFIGLNPNSADTDGDGIADFLDSNPKYKSGTDKFTAMYETLVDHPTTTKKYSFVEILTDCEYFQAMNPKNIKVLVYTTSEKAPVKDDVLDHFFPGKYSKMKTYKNYDNVYFTDFSDPTGDGTISAEFVNGKWKFDKKYTVEFGM
ncbi:hypothetical protein Q73A0000_07560 [Kaistella flava (ex Peng et al. 2021)]|uniref:Lipoprotein n=1 Tax=Kaistella flava (ex Peng et al. 2021) TaxID=2038776 RepID=A0A7M2Y7U4_9FLAO|nr:hypothetical protein [Kaistella flava (ex Peng et al. 2021)]QOW10231.1 hypothetical protein Q73A0000_07560 [Kaistella flava (ex Peng et al. 2021)]